MKILITGATGRVGSHLVRQLAEHHHVAATGRTVHPRTQGRVTWHRADLADPQPWTALLDDVDAAFLFPAFGHTHHFIDAATEVGLQKLVLLSSGAVNDTQNSLIKLDEPGTLEPGGRAPDPPRRGGRTSQGAGPDQSTASGSCPLSMVTTAWAGAAPVTAPRRP